jgi:hypothetical protein
MTYLLTKRKGRRLQLRPNLPLGIKRIISFQQLRVYLRLGEEGQVETWVDHGFGRHERGRRRLCSAYRAR